MKDQLFCFVRHIFVARTPEECVRQGLLNHLFHMGGYAPHLTRVELPLTFFRKSEVLPERRLDIVCFQKKDADILPFLLVECKAKRPTSLTVTQLFGYNFFVKSPFTAIAWNHCIVIHRGEAVVYEGDIKNMPSHEDLYTFV